MCLDQNVTFLRSYPAAALGPGAQAIADGRRYVVQRLTELGADEAQVQIAALLASEVLTNAVRHGPPPGDVQLHVREDRVRVSVSDGAEQAPVMREAGAHGGWGLHLLESGALDWGHHEQQTGKCVWFEVPLQSPRSS
jgi:anti-sigma regulatory factor (Ser/Thr protein kinase)